MRNATLIKIHTNEEKKTQIQIFITGKSNEGEITHKIKIYLSLRKYEKRHSNKYFHSLT